MVIYVCLRIVYPVNYGGNFIKIPFETKKTISVIFVKEKS